MFACTAQALKCGRQRPACGAFGLGVLLLNTAIMAADAPAEKTVVGPAPVVGQPTPVQYLRWAHHSESIYTTGQFNGLGAWMFSIRAQTELTACTLSQLLRLEHHANSMAVGSRTSAIVLGTNVGIVELRDGRNLLPRRTFEVGARYSVYAVAIDSEEEHVAACGTDGTVFVWDVDGEAPVYHLQTTSREGERMASLAFSPDGKTLAALSRYGSLTLWDLASGNSIGEPADNTGGETSELQFTPDGDRIVVVERAAITFWHPIHKPSPRVIVPPEEVCPRYTEDELLDESRPGFGNGIRFAGLATLSHDARHVASIVENGGVAIWDLESQEVLATLPPPAFVATVDHPGMSFESIRLSPDGRRVAAAASSGELVVWQVPGI